MNELKFILMNYDSLHKNVDRFIVTESNYSHSGEKLNRILLEEQIQKLRVERKKFEYYYVNLESLVKKNCNNPDDMHFNEQIIRNIFTNFVTLQEKDIVIAVDADEVLYVKKVKKYVKRIENSQTTDKSYVLKLHQMIYKLNLNWTNCNFRGPIIANAEFFLKKEKPNWRYLGKRTFGKSGIHFSWVMTPSEMVKKINSYAHKSENMEFANEELLEKAIVERRYPFEPSRPFRIKKIADLNQSIYPKSVLKNLTSNDLKDLFEYD